MTVEQPRTAEFLRGKSLFLLEADRFNRILKRYFLGLGMLVTSYPTDDSMISNIIYKLREAPPGYALIHFLTGGEEVHYNRLSDAIFQRYEFDKRIVVAHANLNYALPLYHEYLATFRQRGIPVISREMFGEQGYEKTIKEALLQLPE